MTDLSSDCLNMLGSFKLFHKPLTLLSDLMIGFVIEAALIATGCFGSGKPELLSRRIRLDLALLVEPLSVFDIFLF